MYGNTESMRQRLHHIYDQQIRMTGALEPNQDIGLGCYNCNTAFKLGSSMIPENYGYGDDTEHPWDGYNTLPFVRNPITGRQIGNPYPGSHLTGVNAWDASEPFFYRPINTGGRQMQMRELKDELQRIPYPTNIINDLTDRLRMIDLTDIAIPGYTRGQKLTEALGEMSSGGVMVGGRRKKFSRKPKREMIHIPAKSEEESVKEDLHGLIDQLIPLGYKIKDIYNIFSDAYSRKYGGASDTLLRVLQDVGEHQYFY